MKNTHIIKSLNMNAAEVLTLEKTPERLEFEALPFDTAAKIFDSCECKAAMLCGTYKG